MTYFVEIRNTVQRQGPPHLVPLAEVHKHTGFRSIVAYDEDVVAVIRSQGGTQNLRGHPVYADTVFLDFDNHDPGEFRLWLQSSGLAFSEWNSGGRSVHFHIPLVPIYGPWVTQAIRAWVLEHAPTADISFYHNAGLYRLPGTYHAKHAGRRKTQTDSRSGEPLVLTEPPAARRTSYQTGEEGDLVELYTLLTKRVTEGHRAPMAWRIATVACEAGLSAEEALEHLRWWNERMVFPPRDDLTLQKQTESAYRRLAKRTGL